MSTVAVVTSQHADEEWVFRALDGAVVVVDSAPMADLIIVSDDCLAAVTDHLPEATTIVVLGDPANPPPRAIHVVTRAWHDEHLRTLLTALSSGRPLPEPPLAPPTNPGEARDAQRAINAGRKLAAATDLAGCETTTVEILLEIIEADRAYLLYYDDSDGSLWSEGKLKRGDDDRRAVTGLAGFAARTGRPAHATSAGNDARFAGAIDDPDGDSADHVFAHPVFGSDGVVHAVLVCARRARRPDFGAEQTMLLARFARLVTPVLDQLTIQVHSQAIIDDAAGDQGLFRREAVEAQAMPRWGDVVRVAPRWLSWAYWMLVVLLAASVVFVVMGTVSTYSAGPAIIRSTARTAITARTAGNVVAVDVVFGDKATPQTVIARLDDTDERAAVERLEREFETQLRNHMLDPGDASADGALRTVRNSLETARTALGERLIRAPRDGIVGDIRVRPGQRVVPGDIIASILDSSQGLEVIALLPGEDRPQLAPGMAVRLELTGYRYAYQTVTIESVSSDVLAPAEAKRVLGAEFADGLQLTGPVVLVRGRLPTAEFEVDGRTFRYHDGMVGIAEVRVRTEPIVFTLIPGTRRFR